MMFINKRVNLLLRTHLWLIVCLFGTVVPGGAASTNQAAVRKALQANYARYCQGIMKRDLKAMASVQTSNYMFRPEKLILRKQTEANMSFFLDYVPHVRLSSAAVKIQKITMKSGTVVAMVTLTTKGTGGYPGSPRQALKMTSQRRDTWIKTSRGWKMRFTEQLSNQMKKGDEAK